MDVTETFFSLEVSDMARATAFYVNALGATVTFTSPDWSSLLIARVRIGLFLHREHQGGAVGLHFAVKDLTTLRPKLEQAGGQLVGDPIEVAPGVVIASAMDTEGNTFTLRQD